MREGGREGERGIVREGRREGRRERGSEGRREGRRERERVVKKEVGRGVLNLLHESHEVLLIVGMRYEEDVPHAHQRCTHILYRFLSHSLILSCHLWREGERDEGGRERERGGGGGGGDEGEREGGRER